MSASASNVPFRHVVIALTVGAVLWSMAAPAAAFAHLLPEEDRRLLQATEDADGHATRLFDLLPVQEDVEVDDDVETDAGPDEVEAQRDEAEADEAEVADDEVVHELAPGESLADVAKAYGIPGEDGWRRLYDANPDIVNPDLVEVGTPVRIPDADEDVEPRELPTPARPSRGVSRSGGARGDVWDQLAACESGGNWAADTGNGYYGGLQFSVRSWQAVGGTGMPHHHDRSVQIAMGQRLRAAQGWGAWPSCARRLGLY